MRVEQVNLIQGSWADPAYLWASIATESSTWATKTLPTLMAQRGGGGVAKRWSSRAAAASAAASRRRQVGTDACRGKR